MKQILFLFVCLIAMFTNAQEHEFFGCKFGDSYDAVKAKLTERGYDVSEEQGRISVKFVTFAGINLDEATLFFEGKFCRIGMGEHNTPKKTYNETLARLKNKYGEPFEQSGVSGHLTTTWLVGTTQITIHYGAPTAYAPENFNITYNDMGNSPDEL